MKKIYETLKVGILISAFFIAAPAFAVQDENAVPQKECAVETQENVLTKGIEESPELLKTVIEGNELSVFFERMRKYNMLIGSTGIDKIYVFYSENHPTWVYVYFLNQGCILDVKFTFKNLIEYFITGDESLIKRQDDDG